MARVAPCCSPSGRRASRVQWCPGVGTYNGDTRHAARVLSCSRSVRVNGAPLNPPGPGLGRGGHYRPWSLASRRAEAPMGRQAVFTPQHAKGRRELLRPRAECVPRERRERTGRAWETLSRRHQVNGCPGQRGHLPSGVALRLLDKMISLYFPAAFSTPGSQLQAVDDDPRLAPGNPELHEDTTVSFRPGSEQTQPGDRRDDRTPGGGSVPIWSANAV